ncbi:MAG: polysulfide reductase NrfD [Clostridia bacterium]|nr:polysulfide reductase NrfD [Clostridia bacterium]
MNTKNWSFKITPVRIFLFALVGMAALLGVYRLFTGLGGSTNLNDQWPWGLWIVLDLTVVALAGAGYSLTLLSHVLHIKKFKSVARRALLISLMGYIFVLLTLILEIGRWDNFWRPIVSWGYHSPMFEVYMCILAYMAMMLLEFTEILTEKIGKRWAKLVHAILPVVFIFAALLPFGHQASLGAIYLIFPDKLHPIWFTPMLPWLFLISSFFVGLAVVVFETLFSSKLRNQEVDMEALKGLAKVSACIMIGYLVLKIGDLISKGAFSHVFSGTVEGNMFLLEMIIGVVLPIIIAFSPMITKKSGLALFSGCAIIGVVLNRFNVIIVGMYDALGPGYVPSWIEWGISIGLMAVVILMYTFIVENFAIFSPVEKFDEEKGYVGVGRKHGVSY